VLPRKAGRKSGEGERERGGGGGKRKRKRTERGASESIILA
jgi:hypothetical protein